MNSLDLNVLAVSAKLELYEGFKELEFDEELHKYTIDGQTLISTTTFIEKITDSFDSYNTSESMAKVYNWNNPAKQPRFGEYYRKRWRYLGDQAKALGSRVHLFSELYPHFDSPSDIYEQGVLDFFKWFDERFILITQEMKLYSKQYRKAGTCDMLALDKETGGIVLFDWKTSGEIFRYYKGKKLSKPFNKLTACDFNKYSIQLSDYANMIEMGTTLKIQDSYVIWLHDFNAIFKKQESANYKYEIPVITEQQAYFGVYKCHDLKDDLLEMYSHITISDDKRCSDELRLLY